MKNLIYKIHFTKRSEKELKKLDPQLKKKLLTKIKHLSKERTSYNLKPLKGKNVAQFRLRVGDYRVLYDVYDSEKTVLILAVGHRRDIYR